MILSVALSRALTRSLSQTHTHHLLAGYQGTWSNERLLSASVGRGDELRPRASHNSTVRAPECPWGCQEHLWLFYECFINPSNYLWVILIRSRTAISASTQTLAHTSSHYHTAPRATAQTLQPQKNTNSTTATKGGWLETHRKASESLRHHSGQTSSVWILLWVSVCKHQAVLVCLCQCGIFFSSWRSAPALGFFTSNRTQPSINWTHCLLFQLIVSCFSFFKSGLRMLSD